MRLIPLTNDLKARSLAVVSLICILYSAGVGVSAETITNTVNVPFEFNQSTGTAYPGNIWLRHEGRFQIPTVDSTKFQISSVSVGLYGQIGGAVWTSEPEGDKQFSIITQISLQGSSVGADSSGDSTGSSFAHVADYQDFPFWQSVASVYFYDGTADGSPDRWWTVPATITILSSGSISGISTPPAPTTLAFYSGVAIRVTYVLEVLDTNYVSQDLPLTPTAPVKTNQVFDLPLSRDLFYAPYSQLPTTIILPALPGPSLRHLAGQIELTFEGVLQESDDSIRWSDVDPQPSSPWSFTPTADFKFYRVRSF